MIYKDKSPHGGDIYKNKVLYDFSANTNPFGTPKEVKDAIIKHIDELDKYPDPYATKLTTKIAEYENIPTDYILCGNGAADIIYSFAGAVKPRKALIIAPTFSEYETSLKEVNTQIDYYVLTEENHFMVDDGIYEKLSAATYDVVYLCNPNNPTGLLTKKNTIKAILNICKENHTILFLDECFMDLVKDAKDSLVDNLDQYQNLFILKAFTKSFGMAGIRLGYGLSSNSTLLKKMSKQVPCWNVSTVAQIAGVEALTCKDFLSNTIEYIEKEKEYLLKELENLKIKVYLGKANYLFFKSIQGLDKQLLDRGILIRSCNNYIGLDDTFYRTAVKSHEENEILIHTLEEILWQK